MPTLFRLLFVLALLAAMVWGAMEAMVTYLHPQPRQIERSVSLPSPRR